MNEFIKFQDTAYMNSLSLSEATNKEKVKWKAEI